jgi:hypothetical protein
VQVEPIKPTLKAPGTNRLKLKSDEALSSFAFNFNLRRYSVDVPNFANGAKHRVMVAYTPEVGLGLTE